MTRRTRLLAKVNLCSRCASRPRATKKLYEGRQLIRSTVLGLCARCLLKAAQYTADTKQRKYAERQAPLGARPDAGDATGTASP